MTTMPLDETESAEEDWYDITDDNGKLIGRKNVLVFTSPCPFSESEDNDEEESDDNIDRIDEDMLDSGWASK